MHLDEPPTQANKRIPLLDRHLVVLGFVASVKVTVHRNPDGRVAPPACMPHGLVIGVHLLAVPKRSNEIMVTKAVRTFGNFYLRASYTSLAAMDNDAA